MDGVGITPTRLLDAAVTDIRGLYWLEGLGCRSRVAVGRVSTRGDGGRGRANSCAPMSPGRCARVCGDGGETTRNYVAVEKTLTASAGTSIATK